MNALRFDGLARALARGINRRAALRLIAGGTLGVALKKTESPALAQTPCQTDPPCVASVGSCFTRPAIDGSCVCLQSGNPHFCGAFTCSSDSDCTSGMICIDGSSCNDGMGRCWDPCAPNPCPSGQTMCGRSCVDLTSDVLNCGKCGYPCGGGEGPVMVCIDSACQCDPSLVTCGNDTCIDFASNAGHCGACGNACPTGDLCCDSRCVSRSDAQRFCHFCGYLGGWPQDCNADETCDRGICVSSGGSAGSAEQVQLIAISESCDAYHSDWIDGPYDALDDKVLKLAGCTLDEGVTIQFADSSGAVLGSCTTAAGICRVGAPSSSLPLTATMTNPPSGTTVANNPVNVEMTAAKGFATFIKHSGRPADASRQLDRQFVERAGHQRRKRCPADAG